MEYTIKIKQAPFTSWRRKWWYSVRREDGNVWLTGVTAYGTSRWDWAFTEDGAKRSAERVIRKDRLRKAQLDRAEASLKTIMVGGDGIVVDPEPTPEQAEPLVTATIPQAHLPALPEGEITSLRLTFGQTTIDRPQKFCSAVATEYGSSKLLDPTDKTPANVVISRMPDGRHAPCIDIDLPCELVQSRSKGHYHLYIDKLMSEEAYFKLLDALAEAGIVERGYVAASKDAKTTILRLPPKEDQFLKLRNQVAVSGELFK